MEDRVILHCDCNSFFASVEMALNPEYKNVPMAVCGSQEDRHGIVLAKNELAKKYGIATADTVYSAKKACPGLVIVPPHHSEYMRFSKMVNAIYAEYTDTVEPFGIDESWLDVTASHRLFGGGEKIADEIRTRIKNEVGITISVGVSFCKVFAKLGSDYKKPDAVTLISRENFKEIVHPMPVSSLLFVGKRTKEVLATLGIRTIGDLAASPKEILLAKLGKSGEVLSKYARGEDDSTVSPLCKVDSKSIGNGFTFKHDLTSTEEIRAGVDFLTEEIGRRLRECGKVCSTVTVSIKDENLSVLQRQRPSPRPTDIGSEISNVALEIIKDFWSPGKPIRSITVTATSLSPKQSLAAQMDIFGEDLEEEVRARRRVMEETVDIIRQRHGGSAVVRGISIAEKMPGHKTSK